MVPTRGKEGPLLGGETRQGAFVGLSKAAQPLQRGVWGKEGHLAQEAMEPSGRKRLVNTVASPGI